MMHRSGGLALFSTAADSRHHGEEERKSCALLTLFCFVLLCQRKLMNHNSKWMTAMDTMELLSCAGMTAM
ncbi:hypothetical protein AMEX_G11407 [Astyanax mexicanus]|uniref:Uncharacterized protein n=1 Tax=Astyanax mexicanus TaxID=7994 RepID=A0A8T2LU82_ASTMX|nr:hypothetical protein AMEX_G11407 [Astyanax mexicanus]